MLRAFVSKTEKIEEKVTFLTKVLHLLTQCVHRLSVIMGFTGDPVSMFICTSEKNYWQ